jgi:type II secretory pathway component PulJ
VSSIEPLRQKAVTERGFTVLEQVVSPAIIASLIEAIAMAEKKMRCRKIS